MTDTHRAKNRILVIGLDGATFDLIKPWAAEGKLPMMRRLLAEGSHGNLRSVPNMNSAPAWSSFATGTNPGKHGIFYFEERIPGTYSKRYLNGSHRLGESFWKILSAQGTKVCVINVPLTFPAEEIDGIMLAGLDTPGVESEGFAYPPAIVEELSSRVGDYVIEPGIPGFVKAGRKDQALARLFDAAGKRLAYASYLMSKYPWELFIVVFTAIDAVQHFFWKDMDLQHPEHDTQKAAAYGDAILRVYERMDEVVGTLVEESNPSAVIIMSDHGGGFNQRGAEYLNGWLQKKGLLSYIEAASGDSLGASSFRSLRDVAVKQVGSAYHQLDRRLSREAKLKLVRLFPGVREQIESAISFRGIDWSATRAYADGVRDEIWINLRGREPEGIIGPGMEYEELRGHIIDELTACRDTKSGEKVVDGVYRREEIYWGECVERAPDISVRWRTDFVISGLRAGPHDDVPDSEAVPPALNNGGHRMDGMLIMEGKHIRKGVQLERARIVDIAPTVLHLFGAKIPAHMDGRVLEDALEESFLTSHPVTVLPSEKEADHEGVGREYSEEDSKVIEDRLRGMGYIN